MLWVITCDTVPNMDAIREKTQAAHHAYMKAQKDIMILAGAVRSDDGKTVKGSLFLLHMNSRAEAQAFVDAEPYNQAGIFTNFKITRMTRGQWNPGAAEGADIPK